MGRRQPALAAFVVAWQLAADVLLVQSSFVLWQVAAAGSSKASLVSLCIRSMLDAQKSLLKSTA